MALSTPRKMAAKMQTAIYPGMPILSKPRLNIPNVEITKRQAIVV
jgi:hypothetical protein